MADFPYAGADYDYASDLIRCHADKLGAKVFFIAQPDWPRPIRVLGYNWEDAKERVARELPPLPNPNASPEWFVRDVQHCFGDRVPPEFSAAQQRRLAEILARVAREAVNKVNRSLPSDSSDYRIHLQAALRNIVADHCKVLLAASTVSDAKIKARIEAEVERNEMRRALANELKSSRKRLRRLKKEIAHAKATLLIAANGHCELHQYGAVPAPMVEASHSAQGIPAVSGIYFVWAGGKVVYVGQSVRLSSRCAIRNHHAIFAGEMLSWVPEPLPRLNVAESFYIGILKPERNFGGRGRR